ncbi:MAG: methionyl-tRNA formyltransferase [Ignavibacteriae bacterium HGW-Ignavibacteriae-3]|nr:MAG: methionyl-tRNA formyltransferase [Ignavibacteriae bacterium HGW-Ignavibacteriae-3]
MKIVFMGTPEFAIPSLKRLFESDHKIAAVVSAPDKERGRGKQISSTPVKQFAVQNNIEVLTPFDLNDESFISRLKELDADLFIVVAFRILPKKVYSIPKRGSFNLHGSLLPKYRGAAPIQWALINGDKETGVTTFFLEDKVDTGNIIIQQRMEIDEYDDFGSLHDKMMIAGADVVIKTVELIENGHVNVSKQNNELASPAPKITKEICRIDWNKSALEIHNLVKGLSPYPCAYFIHGGKSYKVYKTSIVDSIDLINEILLKENSQSCLKEGKFSTFNSQLFAGTGSGILQLFELQPEGRKRMTSEEFLRGYSLI